MSLQFFVFRKSLYFNKVLQTTRHISFFKKQQVAGTIILGIGCWLAVDKASFISLLKMVESEHLEVSLNKNDFTFTFNYFVK